MTQQIGNALDIQGKEDRFSSDFRHASDVSPVHSPMMVLSVKPKRKRGRPRKALPLNILTDNLCQECPGTPHVDRSRKKIHSKKDFFRDDSVDDSDTPFPKNELTTLDEFEKLVEPDSGALHDFTRIDKPASKLAAALPNQKKFVRRRQIDPATCERDYSQSEIEFMNALNEYKRSSGRLFPTCSEILEVLKNLGYEKREDE